jgi:hypothetical protein
VQGKRAADNTYVEAKILGEVDVESICPTQCVPEYNVLLCHHADGLNMVQLARCVNAVPSIAVV